MKWICWISKSSLNLLLHSNKTTSNNSSSSSNSNNYLYAARSKAIKRRKRMPSLINNSNNLERLILTIFSSSQKAIKAISKRKSNNSLESKLMNQWTIINHSLRMEKWWNHLRKEWDKIICFKRHQTFLRSSKKLILKTVWRRIISKHLKLYSKIISLQRWWSILIINSFRLT